jgi:amino acid transporter
LRSPLSFTIFPSLTFLPYAVVFLPQALGRRHLHIVGIVLNCGGGKGEFSEYVGGRNFRDPGALANGFKGVCAVFVTAAFSFAGTELIGLAATETPNPRATLPAAVKGTFCTSIFLPDLVLSLLRGPLPSVHTTILPPSTTSPAPPFLCLLFPLLFSFR